MKKRVSTAGCERKVAVGVALGWSHYPKLEGGLESGGFQSVSVYTSCVNNLNLT